MSPPAKSVRPTDPAKSTSPENRWPCGVERDRGGRVARNGGRVEVDPGHGDELAAVQEVVGLVRNGCERAQVAGLAPRHPHVDPGRFGHALHRFQVVVVAVGHEHAGGRPATVGEHGEHGVGRVARVDDDGLGRALARDEVAVRPVGAQGQLHDVQH